MRKGWWIGLCIIFLMTNLFLGVKLRSSQKNPFSGRIFLKEDNVNIELPRKESLLTLIVYFSHRSCEECMKEAFYWNKLFKDLPRNDLSIVGIVPGNEEKVEISKKWNIMFPVYYDKDLLIAKKFLISITPFKIVLHRDKRILHMAPTYYEEKSQKRFYFIIIELLRKAKMEEFQIQWRG